MTALGLIFSNVHDGNLIELTARRSMASVPFGGRYRLIDFALSNMVNSGISRVGIITKHNYQSLLNHVGNGADWDLSRRSGGIRLLPPNITAYDSLNASDSDGTRLDSLMEVASFIGRAKEEYIVLSDCDVVCNIDAADMIRRHRQSGADITMAVKRINTGEHKLSRRVRVIRSDRAGRVLSLESYGGEEGEMEVGIGIFVMRRALLYSMLMDARSRLRSDFYNDIIIRNLDNLRVFVYNYEGYYSLISDLSGYFESNLKLLESDARQSLFGVAGRHIYTKVKNSPPAKYCLGATVKNSLIADGCIIEGQVEDSVIFRGVKVGKGSRVKRCVLLQDTCVGDNVSLDCVITDKNVMIKDQRTLAGHPSLPFFIDKGLSV